MKNLLITICARGGSKSVPDKNIKPINGKPLIGYTIEKAYEVKEILSSSFVTEIALSTDSEKIKRVAESFGLNSSYKRPNKFATDKAGKVDAIKDALFFYENEKTIKFDFILDMDVTAPLRTVSDIKESLSMMENDKDAMNLFSVSEPHRNPYFNMVEEKKDGYVGLVKSLDKNILSRQSAPKVYDMNASFYIYRRRFFDLNYKSAITDKSLAYLMSHICFDIDYELDFHVMEYLIREQKLGFNFS
ncbi:MAG: acylneuraminate cytidylyltransferase family protein [Saprospiraceae bacterium]